MRRSSDEPPMGLRADESVYRGIYDAVQAGRLVPGVKLRELELVELFKVSRTTVRSALLRLAHRGLVELSPNRGATVARPSAQDCTHLFEARRAIEGAVVETLCASATEAMIRTLRRHARTQRDAFAAGRQEEGYRLAIAFHRLLAELAGNRILSGYVDDLLGRMPLVILTFGSSSRPDDATHADHIHLVEAIAQRNAAAARGILRRHLKHLETQLQRGAPRGAQTLGEMLNMGPRSK